MAKQKGPSPSAPPHPTPTCGECWSAQVRLLPIDAADRGFMRWRCDQCGHEWQTRATRTPRHD